MSNASTRQDVINSLKFIFGKHVIPEQLVTMVPNLIAMVSDSLLETEGLAISPPHQNMHSLIELLKEIYNLQKNHNEES